MPRYLNISRNVNYSKSILFITCREMLAAFHIMCSIRTLKLITLDYQFERQFLNSIKTQAFQIKVVAQIKRTFTFVYMHSCS